MAISVGLQLSSTEWQNTVLKKTHVKKMFAWDFPQTKPVTGCCQQYVNDIQEKRQLLGMLSWKRRKQVHVHRCEVHLEPPKDLLNISGLNSQNYLETFRNI